MLTTNNEAWGFFGTINGDSEKLWKMAFTSIQKITGDTDWAIRAFLDSKHGRHFADNVNGNRESGDTWQCAIDEAIKTWMGWTIDRITSKDYGIPRGLPYLTGWVAHEGILAEAE